MGKFDKTLNKVLAELSDKNINFNGLKNLCYT